MVLWLVAVAYKLKVFLLVKTIEEYICLVWLALGRKPFCFDALSNFKLVNFLKSLIASEFDIVHELVVWVIHHHVHLSLAAGKFSHLA